MRDIKEIELTHFGNGFWISGVKEKEESKLASRFLGNWMDGGVTHVAMELG